MPNTHRGVPVPGNHRPTPRLAQLMAKVGNMGLEDGQAYLNNYRSLRDSSVFNLKARKEAKGMKKDISEAIEIDKRGKGMKPFSYYEEDDF